MKKLLLILCFLPLFGHGATIYKILSDTVFIGSIPYRTATGELLLFNNTKDTTESVLYNVGNGKTEFKKVRLIRLNDSTYVFKIGTTVIGDSIKIRSSGSGGGGGGSGTVTDFIFTNGNGFTGTVGTSTTTPTLSIVADSIFKFASVKRVLDSITALRNIRKVDSIYKKSTNRDLTYFKINGTEYSFKDSTGSSSQTLSISNDTLSISGGNTVVLPFIPLSGTASGSPVTGDIEIDGGDISIYRKNLDDDYYENIIFGQGSIVINSTDYNQTVETGTSLTINPNGIGLQSFDSTSRGISCEQDFSTNITDLDYTQKIYVDGQIADTASLLRSLISSGGGSTVYAGQGLFYRNDSLLITGRMTEPLSILSVGSPINNPIGGVATVWVDIPTRPTIGISCYADDFSATTGIEVVNFNTVNTQVAQVGIFDQASSSDLDDTKLFFVNAAGDKHTYLIGLPTTTYDQIVVRDSATNELAVVSARHYLDSVVQVASIPQSLSRTFTDSITIAITDGGNINIPYGVDSVSIVGDSLIVKKGAIRYSYLLSASGGTGTVTSVATNTGTGITGGTITSSGTLAIDTATIIATKSYVNTVDATKQATLVSGTNIKTINSTTILGSGDISLPTATSTTTFTNKRITARVDSTTSSATPTINTDNVDTYKLTAQAADITSFTTNLTGTPTDDQILHIVIIGTAARAITWGSKFESSTVTLPTTTVTTNRLDVYFIWNTATGKWRCGGTW
jgi:hypothetical protein